MGNQDIIGLCLRLVREDHRITELNLDREKLRHREYECKNAQDLCPYTGNPISYDGGRALSGMLKKNTTLTVLKLRSEK